LARKRRYTPNRPQQKDDKGLLSFDPLRRNVFKWGLIAGAAGGLFMLRPEFIWQVVGVLLVVFIANYHINKAAQRISRWHATFASFLGVMIGMFGVIIIGTLIMVYFEAGGAAQ